MSQIFIKLPASKTRKKIICICNMCRGKKEPCNLWTRDTYIEKYGICKELVSPEPQADTVPTTNSQIGESGTSLPDISSPTLIDFGF